MRPSHLIVIAGMLTAACATPSGETKSTTIASWEGRDINELVAVIGPFDSSNARGDARTYDWFRFSNCKLTARTTTESKIQKIEMEGTSQGCSSYAQKIGK